MLLFCVWFKSSYLVSWCWFRGFSYLLEISILVYDCRNLCAQYASSSLTPSLLLERCTCQERVRLYYHQVFVRALFWSLIIMSVIRIFYVAMTRTSTNALIVQSPAWGLSIWIISAEGKGRMCGCVSASESEAHPRILIIHLKISQKLHLIVFSWK